MGSIRPDLGIAVGHSEDVDTLFDIIHANASASPQAIIDNVISAMNDFRENLEPQYDAILVAVKVDGDL